MPVRANDSYLKSVPNSTNFVEKVARFRQKGFHADPVNGNDLDTVATYPILPPWDPGTPKWVIDATANDSDKTFTVPAEKVWEMESVEAGIVATATVGNRYLLIQIYNAAGVCVSPGKVTVAIPASNRGGNYMSIGATEGTAVRCSLITPASANNAQAVCNLPDRMVLSAGMYIRAWDIAAVDAAADDMTVVLHYIEYDA